MTSELKEKFLNQFDLTPGDIIDRVYRKPFPNRFLASLSPFLVENINEPSVRSLVLSSFISFIKRNVMQYDYEHNKVHFIGSVAYHYQELLIEACKETNIQLGTIMKSPMENLIAYHEVNTATISSRTGRNAKSFFFILIICCLLITLTIASKRYIVYV